ncbi:MAG: PAS domain S-box protein [Chthoniobacterales bacterium]|nr:PAS domain S-box protein [Chthoniobacterales bacterium]
MPDAPSDQLDFRKGIAQADLASELRFRAMFEQASVGIVQVAEGGHFLAANPGFCEFIGYSEEELNRVGVRDVTHPEDFPAEEELTRQLAAGAIPEYTLEKRYVRKNGEIVWGSMTAKFVRPADGQLLYTLAIIHAIGDRKQIQEDLRQSEQRFRNVADNIPQVIWTNDATGEANYFNRRWYEYSGLSYEQSAGPGWQAIVHPDDEAESKQQWHDALNKGEVFDAEYRLRAKDGEYRWFIGRNVPLRDNGKVISWFGTATDIDELKQTQARRMEVEQRFQLLVEGTPDYAMFLLNPDNKITFWSSGAERVFGWSATEAVGKTGSLIFTPEDRTKGEVEKELVTAAEKGFVPDRRWHLRKDGSRLWVDGVMRRIDKGDGTLRGFAKICRDGTDLYNAAWKLRHAHDDLEQRVQYRTAELQAMNETLEDEMTRRQRLEREILEVTERERARISQDLHDSLCQELTATAFLLKSRAKTLGREDPEAGEALSEGAEMVNKNAGLARDLARGLHPLELGTGGLVAALRELAARTTDAVTCRCECPRSLRVPDPNVAVNLYRIAQEAVTNALKHAKPREVVICVERAGSEIVLSVCDDGARRRKSKIRDAGLGIQMMQYRASVSGGSLTVETRARGQGTKVTCRVPAKA